MEPRPLGAQPPVEGRFGPGGFAGRLLSDRKLRTLIAISGISFAVLFMFMQLGLYGAVVSTATAISSRLDADLVLVSSRYIHLAETGSLQRRRLFQALGVPGVERASPIYVRHARCKDPATEQRCSLVTMGFSVAEGSPLRLPEVASLLPNLRPIGTVLLDSLTQRRCIPSGQDVEIRERTSRIAGQFSLGVGFLGDGALLVSDETFSEIFDAHNLDDIHLGILKLRPGFDPQDVARRLREILPSDTRVLTPDELRDLQTRHWVRDTAIGNMFGLGTLVGFVVGMVVLYQVLSNDIRNHLAEFATLKAMGYANRQLYRFVLEQALMFAVFGFLPGLLASTGLYAVIHDATRLPIGITGIRVAGVFGLCLLMCTSSALLTLRKIRTADPAELF